MTSDLFTPELPCPPQGTTAAYPNRQRDKARVEALKGWAEAGNDLQEFKTTAGILFARGYSRIVYGDHGPYLEFLPSQVIAPLTPHFQGKAPANAYYEWLDVKGDTKTKVYSQLKTVADLPNPPSGGFRGNRPEGYADYKPQHLYVSVWELMAA